MFKVFRIDSGRIIRAGFNDEEQANDWLDNSSLENANYAIEEMDVDEEEQWSEMVEDSDGDENLVAPLEDEEDDDFKLNYRQDDEPEDPDENLVSEFDPDID